MAEVEYPRWIEHPSEKDDRGWPLRVLVKNADEEAEVVGKPKPENKSKGGW